MQLYSPQPQACLGLSEAFLQSRCTSCKLKAWHPLRQPQPNLRVNKGCRLRPVQAEKPGQAGFEAALGLLQDPEVCKLMYPYVPENMRSPDGVQLMMSDPEIRDKLESALQQAFKDNTDALDKLDVKSSAEEIGIRPADFIQAIMADPELSKACSRPEVLSAVLECTKDGSKTAQYEHDPDVKKVLKKLQQLLPD